MGLEISFAGCKLIVYLYSCKGELSPVIKTFAKVIL